MPQKRVLYNLIRSVLFTLSPENAHRITLKLLGIALQTPFIRRFFIHRRDKSATTEFCGLRFPNKIGLAAGFDKNAVHIREMALLGFGHIEVGTVTPLPQPGNPKPRLFRLPEDHALINRMGFNNDGVDTVARNLSAYRNRIRPGDFRPVIGGNIGKNKVTPNEDAFSDYAVCYDKLYHLVDYFVINVSSPNTPDLRKLQEKDELLKIIHRLDEVQKTKRLEFPELPYRPLLLKIAPDLGEDQLDDVINLTAESSLDGLIVSNTTISRKGLATDKKKVDAIGEGGLSGEPLRLVAKDMLKRINEKSRGSIPLIGVGGISSVEDAKARIESGAGLVQLYTGFIYQGPQLIRKLAVL